MTNKFLNDKTISEYLALNIYQIDEIFCRFSFWSRELYDFEVKRYYRHLYQVDFDKYEYEDIDKEEYFNNIEDRRYITGLNYDEFITAKDFDEFFREFNYYMCERVIQSTENDFIDFIKEKIDTTNSDGKSKSLLKSVLLHIQNCISDLGSLPKNNLNSVQLFLIDIYSTSYKSSCDRLLNYYKNIYPNIISEFEINPQLLELEKIPSINSNKYPEIFKNNAFDVWEKLFEDFDIKSSSRTDVKFCFEAMSYDGLIHSTVTQTAFLNWINNTHQIDINKPNYHNWKGDKKRLSIYNNAKALYIKT